MNGYVGTPEIRFPWEEEEELDQLMEASYTPNLPILPEPATPSAVQPPAQPAFDITQESITPMGRGVAPSPEYGFDPRFALAQAEKGSKDRAFKTALINLAVAMAGGPHQPEMVERERQRPLKRYGRELEGHRYEQQQKRLGERDKLMKQRMGLALMSGKRAESAEQRAKMKDLVTLQKGEYDIDELRHEQQKRRDLNDPKHPDVLRLKEYIRSEQPDFYASLPEEMWANFTMADAKEDWFDFALRRAEKLKRAAAMGGTSLRALEREPGTMPMGDVSRPVPGTPTEAHEEALIRQFPLPEDLPEYVKGMIEQYKHARGKDKKELKMSIEKAAAAERGRVEKGMGLYTHELSKGRIPALWSIYSSMMSVVKDEVRDNKDIEGIGFDAWISGIFGGGGMAQRLFMSEKGRDRQARLVYLRDQLLRVATGAAAPYHEHGTFEKITSSGMWNTDRDFVNGMKRIGEVIRGIDAAARATARGHMLEYADRVFKYADRYGAAPWNISFNQLIGVRSAVAQKPGGLTREEEALGLR